MAASFQLLAGIPSICCIGASTTCSTTSSRTREGDALPEAPSFEVSETDDEFRIKAELPGMDEKDVEVSLEGDLLTVRGEKKREREEKRRSYHLSEVSYGEFSRAMRLPEGVDAERAKAQFKRGVLTLTIPKKDEVKANRRKLEITAG